MSEIPQGRKQLQDALLQAYPNPQRSGCPASDGLVAMARRTIPMQPSDREHIFHCSPCFQTYLEIRTQIRRDRFIRIAGIVALSTLLIGTITYFGYRSHERSPRQFVSALNLQQQPVFRGPNQASVQPSPFVLPRGIVHLTVTLPLGSEPGTYQIGLFQDGQVEPLMSTTGNGSVKGDGSTVLSVDLNSATFRTGQYALGVRKDDSEWSYFALVLR